MRTNAYLFIIIIIFFSCKTIEKKESVKLTRAPGLATMQEFGTKLTPIGILTTIGSAMNDFAGSDSIHHSYSRSMNALNDKPVFIIESIEYNEKGLAVNITGHIETPSTYEEYIAKGGLGVPIYEAVEPNEFGVIFGRHGNIAIREGIVIKDNPLKNADIYYFKIGSETYDKINRASILYQAYEVTRTPFLQNMCIEFQGMLLNSASKDAIIDGIRKFRQQNKGMTETEVMINFLAANESYLEELKRSNREARARIKEGRKMMKSISSACALQTANIVKLFTKMAVDIAYIIFNPFEAPRKFAEYVIKNIPKNSRLKFKNLEDIRKYGNYQTKVYQENLKKNQELWKNAMKITKNF